MNLFFRLANRIALAVCLAALAIPVGAQSTAALIVKFKTDSAKALRPVAERVAELSANLNVPMRHLRTLATGAALVSLAEPASLQEVEQLAARVAADSEVAYAEPDRRRYAKRIPNDEFIPGQSYLSNDPASISAYAAWDITTGSPNTVVAVLDTGIRPHVDLTGRILAGYDMISNPVIANDGDGRDPDPSDPGDWVTSADLTGVLSGCDLSNSSWHGTSVAGIIASNTNNAQWTAGIDWSARILPVRVLGKCGGVDSDIIDGIAWAGGLAVGAAPANPTPAQVINLSLGGDQSCPQSYKDVINAVYAEGFTRAIVAAAGNESDDVSTHAPASCPGVIAIASTTSTGSLARYSNFGAGIALSAPGGQFNSTTSFGGIVVLSNAGATVPTTDSFRNLGGTSFAAPMVSGTVALMLSVAPNLTHTQVRDILLSTVKPFPPGSTCTTAICGPGIVDAGAAVLAAQAAAGSPATVTVVEYYNATLDHYFITWVPAEQANLDAGNTPTRWTRTGYTFKAYTTAQASTSPVCRYYLPPQFGDSHFFGRGTSECTQTGQQHPGFVLEDPAFMQMFLPAAGVCPANTANIYRVFSNRADANHRYMTDPAVRDQMVARGWVAEGDGPNLVVMCAPL